VAILGGMRVRVLASGEAIATGRTPGPPPPKLIAAVLDVRPPGEGVVHLWKEGRWIVRGKGALADERFLQRLRNTLATL
jgi:hypothetical protein